MKIAKKIFFILMMAHLGVASAQAGTQIFLKLSGIEGESTDPSHDRWIDVLSWNWSIANEAHSSTNVKMSLTFTKHVNTATPVLMRASARGRHIPNAVLIVRITGDLNEPVQQIKYEMKDVTVTSYQTNSDAAEDGSPFPEEEISMNFERVTLNYGSRQDRYGSITPGFDFNWYIRKTAQRP